MTKPVSLRPTSLTQQTKQPSEEKSAFAARVSPSFNSNQAIALVVIASLFFLAFGSSRSSSCDAKS